MPNLKGYPDDNEKARRRWNKTCDTVIKNIEDAIPTSAQTREALLMYACDAVNGSREEDYGAPEDNFGNIGELWTAYLKGKLPYHERITPYDVAMMQILLKVARNKAQNPSRDNNVDIAGYAATAEDIRSKNCPKKTIEKGSKAPYGTEGWSIR